MREDQADEMITELKWISWGLVKIPLICGALFLVILLVREVNREEAEDYPYEYYGGEEWPADEPSEDDLDGFDADEPLPDGLDADDPDGS